MRRSRRGGGREGRGFTVALDVSGGSESAHTDARRTETTLRAMVLSEVHLEGMHRAPKVEKVKENEKEGEEEGNGGRRGTGGDKRRGLRKEAEGGGGRGGGGGGEEEAGTYWERRLR